MGAKGKRDASRALVPRIKKSCQVIIPPRHPIPSPQIDPNLEHLPFHLRGGEAFRYTLNSLEYALSPSGRLRQWCKIQLFLFLWLTIPLLLVGLPLLGVLAFLIEATTMLVQVAINVGVIMGIVMIIMAFLGIIFVIFK